VFFWVRDTAATRGQYLALSLDDLVYIVDSYPLRFVAVVSLLLLLAVYTVLAESEIESSVSQSARDAMMM